MRLRFFGGEGGWHYNFVQSMAWNGFAKVKNPDNEKIFVIWQLCDLNMQTFMS